MSGTRREKDREKRGRGLTHGLLFRNSMTLSKKTFVTRFSHFQIIPT